jgi:hypothetical protein
MCSSIKKNSNVPFATAMCVRVRAGRAYSADAPTPHLGRAKTGLGQFFSRKFEFQGF